MTKEIEEYIKKNKKIISGFYSGSVGKGSNDQYSDLDIELLVNKDYLSDCKNNIKQLLRILGEIKLIYFFNEKNVKSLIGKNYNKVDIKIHTKNTLIPREKYNKIKIIKDNNQILEKCQAKSKKLKTKLTKTYLEDQFKEAIISQIMISKRLKRGWKWSSLEWINYRVERLVNDLIRMQGKLQFGMTNIENLLRKNELNMLNNSFCKNTTKNEIKRSAKELWKFTKYVYIKKAGLKIPINEKEFFEKF